MTLRFLHIPKTAGSTFTGCLARLYGLPFRFTGDLPADLERFRALSGEARHAVRLVAGHAPRITGEATIDDLPTLTFLRDPIERVKSFCQHVSEGKSPHLRHQFPPERFCLDALLASGTMELDNFQTRVLLGRQSFDVDIRDTADAVRRAVAVLRDLAGVGLVERFDASLMLFRNRFGWPWPLYRSTNQKNPRRTLAFNAAQLARILELNVIDSRVYEAARRQFDDLARNTPDRRVQDLHDFRRLQDVHALIRRVHAVRPIPRGRRMRPVR